jgi:hypothetical protein
VTRADQTQPSLPAADFRLLQGSASGLFEAAATGRLPATLLIEGRAGIGKRLAAARAAAWWLCSVERACGSCVQCDDVAMLRHPDLIWIEASGAEAGERSLKVADIDRLQEHLSYSPGVSGLGGAFRVAVIIDAENLGLAAANRLLKTLEEPPERARLILTSSRPRALLPTIRSRLVRWHVAPPGRDEAIFLTQRLALAAGLRVAEDIKVVASALDQCGLSPGLALEFLRTSRVAEATPLVTELLSARSETGSSEVTGPSEARATAARLARDLGIDAASLSAAAEVALNQLYRRELETAGTRQEFDSVAPDRGLRGALAPQEILRRRRMLAKIHELAQRKRIALNAQLAAESLVRPE